MLTGHYDFDSASLRCEDAVFGASCRIVSRRFPAVFNRFQSFLIVFNRFSMVFTRFSSLRMCKRTS